MCYVGYEDLLFNPAEVLGAIGKFLGMEPKCHEAVAEIVGPPSNEGKAGKWRDVYNEENLEFFFSIVPKDYWALWNKELE